MKIKSKEGAASFYVVAFSTLILLIIAASFTALVIAQITRNSNNDLSRSAYDSAMAGVEDAKLAFYNYQNCIAQGYEAVVPNGDDNMSCGEIIWLMENGTKEDPNNPSANCDVVAKILGRTVRDNGVQIEEGNNTNNMQQSYTCVNVVSSLGDYRASLSAANALKVIQVRFDDGVDASAVKRMKISWGTDIGQKDKSPTEYYSNGSVSFPESNSEENTPNPPALGVALVQASSEYKMSDFTETNGDRTNRGHIYLVPIGGNESVGKEGNYRKTESDYKNVINKNGFLDSNRHTATNLPYGVRCHATTTSDDRFACQAMLDLPEPISEEGKGRANGNFIVAVSLLHGKATDFSLEFFCDGGEDVCGKSESVLGEDEPGSNKQVNLKGVQIAVDSTGKANDLFRRVEVRLEGTDSYAISLLGPLELFGDNNGSSNDNYNLIKDLSVTCEYNFSPTATQKEDGKKSCK